MKHNEVDLLTINGLRKRGCSKYGIINLKFHQFLSSQLQIVNSEKHFHGKLMVFVSSI